MFYQFLFLTVNCYQFLQISISFHRFLLILFKEFCSFFRICPLQCIVTYFSVKECLIFFRLWLLAVQSELVALSSRIVTEVIPVSTFYCKLFPLLIVKHKVVNSETTQT